MLVAALEDLRGYYSRICPTAASSDSIFHATCYYTHARIWTPTLVPALVLLQPTWLLSRSRIALTASLAPPHSTGCSITRLCVAACTTLSVRKVGCMRN